MKKEGFGHSVARARKRAGMSLREMAGRLGVAASTVSRWERGTLAPPARKRARVIEKAASCASAPCAGSKPAPRRRTAAFA
ncbi:MAG: helix-turn-helix transcriptional regulator [Thermodesulfobacteriota bacterium]